MKKNVIIRSVAAVFAVGMTIGFTGCGEDKKGDTKTTKSSGVYLSDFKKAHGIDPDDSNWEYPIETDTDPVEEETKPAQKIDEDSILINMDGMTADEMIDNLWKTADISSGDKFDDYRERIIVSEDEFTIFDKGDKFSWLFSGNSHVNRYIGRISVFSGMKADPVFDGGSLLSRVHLEVSIEDEAFAEELAEKILARLESEGYTIAFDGRDRGLWSLRMEGNGTSFYMQKIKAADYCISFEIPLIGK